MTATVTRIHEHVCLHKLWTASRGWVVTSECHRGQILPLDPPKGRAA